jgi:DNA modification methylase
LKTYKFRVRPFFITSLHYLEWKQLTADVNRENAKQFVLNDVILNMKEQLKVKEVILQINDFKGYRHDQRFSLSEESNHFVREFAEQNQLLLAEGIEILLYLYCKEVFSEQEMKQNGLGNWNIKVEWKK